MYTPISKDIEDQVAKDGYICLKIPERWEGSVCCVAVPFECSYHPKAGNPPIRIGHCYTTVDGNSYTADSLTTDEGLAKFRSAEIMFLEMFIKRLKEEARIRKMKRLNIVSSHQAVPEILIKHGFSIRARKLLSTTNVEVKGTIQLKDNKYV